MSKKKEASTHKNTSQTRQYSTQIIHHRSSSLENKMNENHVMEIMKPTVLEHNIRGTYHEEN